MSRAMEEARKDIILAKQREKEAAEHQRQREAILRDANKDHTADRFVGVTENLDETLKKSTIGLVTLSDFQKTKEELIERSQQAAAKTLKDKAEREAREAKERKKGKRKEKVKLSFEDEEGEPSAGPSTSNVSSENGESAAPAKKRKFTKNPDVDTSFLPDREREERERIERDELRKQWLAEQERIKQEPIEITYSFWDGSGHRKVVEVKKGDDVGHFLGKCRQQFPELRGTTVENLMYIKEDLIIPHHYTFYDFLINKARGKSGPLFNFDVHDDVRVLADAAKEKDEEKSWSGVGTIASSIYSLHPAGKYTILTKTMARM